MYSRKQFIKECGKVIAGVCLSEKLFDIKTAHSKGSTPIISDLLTFDLHTHPKSKERIEDMTRNGLTGAFFSMVADRPILEISIEGVKPKRAYKKGEGWQEFQNQWSSFKADLKDYGIGFSKDYDELIKAKNEGTLCIMAACEGGDFIEGRISRVSEVYELGLRSIQLVHYAPNEIGDLQTHHAVHNGLSLFGSQVVKEMNQMGMLIDVAHASYETVKGVVDATSHPIMLSHSILKMEASRPIGQRAISTEHAQLVASTGGVIGMWPSGFSYSFDEFVDNTFRMIDAAGIDHVSIGTDMDSNFKPVISDYASFFNWTTALQEKGLSPEEVQKVAGGNAARVIKTVLT